MGKSEVVPMPIYKQDNFYAACQGTFKLPPIKQCDDLKEDENGENSEISNEIPENIEVFPHQVAGHVINGKTYGILKNNGRILKPILNKNCFEREVEFYEFMNSTNINDDLAEAKEFIPNYYGKLLVPLNGDNVNCIVLEDLTKYYKEPCVMDIKIGRRTWDPTASYDKIMKEEVKYADSKRELGFCIPGFQVYNLESNKLCKYNKDYGKNLNKETVPQALKTFLNGEVTLCRSLIVQFLACLWRIQLWARKQRHFHFYSSSLLFVYDARRLRELLNNDVIDPTTMISSTPTPKLKLHRSTSLYRPLSLAVLNNNNNDNDKISTGFSGQFSKEGPILKTVRQSKQFDSLIVKSETKCICNSLNRNHTWQKSIRTLKRTHSFQNNYDKEMQCKKQDYTFILDELCMEEQKSEVWATVKMIDFAHVFPAEHHEIDANYLNGIDNLIRLFEDFLVDSE